MAAIKASVNLFALLDGDDSGDKRLADFDSQHKAQVSALAKKNPASTAKPNLSTKRLALLECHEAPKALVVQRVTPGRPISLAVCRTCQTSEMTHDTGGRSSERSFLKRGAKVSMADSRAPMSCDASSESDGGRPSGTYMKRNPGMPCL